MATVGPGIIVPAVPLAPPRVSLLTSVDVVEHRDERFANGLNWLPENCDLPASPNSYWWDCPVGAGTAPTHTKTIDAPEAIADMRPFTIWTGFRCGVQPPDGDEYERRARGTMEAFQSFLIERELHVGTVSRTANFGNFYFEDSPTELNGGADTPYVTALAELEQRLSTCSPGQVGVIHAQPRTVTVWVQNGLVSPEPGGRRLRTVLGTIVVPGAGYDGGGPDIDAETLAAGTIASSYAYGTGMVRVHLGPISRPSIDDRPTSRGINQAEIDRTLNTIVVRVERTVGYQVDPCCHVSVRVDLNTAL